MKTPLPMHKLTANLYDFSLTNEENIAIISMYLRGTKVNIWQTIGNGGTQSYEPKVFTMVVRPQIVIFQFVVFFIFV